MITTEEPNGPEAGERPVTVAASITVNCALLLVAPPTVTVTGPLVAVEGTVTLMLVLLHEVTVGVIPLKLTWLLLWLVPKSVPLIITEPPRGAAGGARLEITGTMKVAVGLTATLSKVAVTKDEVVLLVTARPIYTLVAILMV